MGQGCTLRTNIYFSHKTYTSKDDVMDDIELNEKIIKDCESELMQLAIMTEPAKFWRESEAEVGETPWVWVQNQVLQNIESIKECQEELSKLRTLLFAWDECHNEEGLAIEPLGGTGYDKSYFWGDFINSVYPDGTEAYNYRKSILGHDN